MIAYALFAASGAVAAIGERNALLRIAFVVFSFIFIGLRLETGFDWPVYKWLWYELQGSSFNEAISLKHYMETAFVVTMWFLAQIFSEYEYAQALFAALFIGSTLALARQFAPGHTIAAFVLAISCLVMTLGFSTIRQCIAISFFNLGLIAYMHRRKPLAALLIATGVAFQLSAAIYVLALAMAVLLKRVTAPALFATAASATLLLSAALLSSAELVKHLDSRIPFYLEALAGWPHLYRVLLSVAFAFFGIHAARAACRDSDQETLRALTSILAGVTAGSVLIPVIQDRASYLAWLLYSVFLLSGAKVELKRLAIPAAFVFGVLYSSQFLRSPNIDMFIPYQNSITHHVLGIPKMPASRVDEFYRQYEENLLNK